MKKLLFLFLVIGIFASCKNDSEERRAMDDELLQAYFLENNIDATPVEGTSGVYYKITDEGEGGAGPAPQNLIRCYYKGMLLDGTVFDEKIEGEDEYLEIGVGNLIFGWQVGLQYFSKGAKGSIYIPSHAGYGSQERAGIPAHSILVFDVHVVNFF